MKILSFILVILVLVACGKESMQAEVSRPALQDAANIHPDIIEFLNKQKIQCDGECPISVAKVVVLKNQPPVSLTKKLEASFCTSVLIAPDLMLTSASCIGLEIIKELKKCSDYVYFTFPKSNGLEEEQHFACSRIIESTNLEKLASTEHAAWRNDFALIELKKSTIRPEVKMAINGIDGQDFYTWKINQSDQYTSKLVSESCEPLFNSYMNPFATSTQSPFVPFAGCHFNQDYIGNTGAPIFNSADELVGIISIGLPSDLVEILKKNRRLIDDELAPLVHVTNVGCLKLPGSTFEHTECKKTIDMNLLKQLQNNLIHGEQVFADFKSEITLELKSRLKYFRYRPELVFARFRDNPFVFWYELRMLPECFEQPELWIKNKLVRNFLFNWKLRKSYIYHYSHPTVKLTIPFDRYLNPKLVIEKIENDINYTSVFSPLDLAGSGRSNVMIRVPSVPGSEQDFNQTLIDVKACDLN